VAGEHFAYDVHCSDDSVKVPHLVETKHPMDLIVRHLLRNSGLKKLFNSKLFSEFPMGNSTATSDVEMNSEVFHKFGPIFPRPTLYTRNKTDNWKLNFQWHCELAQSRSNENNTIWIHDAKNWTSVWCNAQMSVRYRYCY